MGQDKVYINISRQFLFGISYDKGLAFELNIACVTIGLGLTKSAKGFGVWVV